MTTRILRSSFAKIAGVRGRSAPILAAAILSCLVLVRPARADCANMLAPLFNPPTGKAVYLTMSSQYAQAYVNGWFSGKNISPADPVTFSAGGPMNQGLLSWPTGGIFSYQVDSLSATIPVQLSPSFPASVFSLKVAISATGVVSLQELMNGLPIPNRPATFVQGQCSAGLVTFRDAKNSSLQWTLSFTTGDAFVPPQ